MIVKYKGPDTGDSWEFLEGTHRTDFDYLNALSLTNLPEPRYDVYVYQSVSVCLSVYVSISMYILIPMYIYVDREREREYA
jgi:hypothetical protein